MDDCQIADQEKTGENPLILRGNSKAMPEKSKKEGRGNGEAEPRVAAVRRRDRGRRSKEPIRREEHHRRLIGSRPPPITLRLPRMKEKGIHQFNHCLAGHMETGVTDRSLAIVFLLLFFFYHYSFPFFYSSLMAAKNVSFLFYIWWNTKVSSSACPSTLFQYMAVIKLTKDLLNDKPLACLSLLCVSKFSLYQY